MPTLVVAGHGMVAHRLAEAGRAGGTGGACGGVVLAEELRAAYDRVALTSYVDGWDPASLALPGSDYADDPHVELRLGELVTSVDRDAKTVTTASGASVSYDALVLATGSRPFVPPVPGHDLPGCFVYRTLDDLDAIRAAAAGAATGGVVGGGLLGLEAANALAGMGLAAHVVEMAPRLMPIQVD